MLVCFLFINPGDIIKIKVIQNIFLSFILALPPSPHKKKLKSTKNPMISFTDNLTMTLSLMIMQLNFILNYFKYVANFGKIFQIFLVFFSSLTACIKKITTVDPLKFLLVKEVSFKSWCGSRNYFRIVVIIFLTVQASSNCTTNCRDQCY